jgi:DNA polymerase-3 subunit alpha
MGAVKTVGEHFVHAIIAEREKDGPFKSFQDFVLRVPTEAMNSRMVEALIKVGAFNKLHPNRAALMAALPELVEAAHQKQDSSGVDMFEIGGEEDSQFSETPLPRVEDWTEKERAAYEKEFLGFYLTEHPLLKYRVEMESFNHTRSSELDEIGENLVGEDWREITMFGCITAIRRMTDKNGRAWAILTMEDLEGTFEAKLFAKSFETYCDLIEIDRVIQIRGRLSVWNNRPSFDGWDVRPAEDLRADATGVEIEFEVGKISEESLRGLRDICRRYHGKRALKLVINHEAGPCEWRLNGDLKLLLSEESLRDLTKIPGRPKVRFFR